MAQNITQTCSADTWTQLTDADITAARVQNAGALEVYIQATSGTTPPTSTGGSITLKAGEVLPSTWTLAEIFPGVSSAARLWARPSGGIDGHVSISHA
ncbi:hypothetical protein [Celeribacter naphthalenivorans]|uniref:hypothetical protein n=1 Tax=Celeribacter naphthalenivorans TaxID=1614694 RepID=UPI001CF9B09A|nr:hypothetical protein [Celeribacter naphthalenivorans]